MTIGKPEADRLLAELDALIGPPPDPYRSEPPPRPRAAAETLPAPPAPALPPQPAQAPPEALAAPSAAAPPLQRAPLVLLAEDDKDYRKVVRYLLSSNGYAVAEAGNGLDALKAARQRTPDLIILDFEMPRMNGYELLQELRSQDETRKVPVVFLTGAANRRHLRAIGLDVARFIEKPLPNAQLLATVMELVTAAPKPPVALAAKQPRLAD
ncbi:MAG: response regulator, partial [Elusimicrobia bacterium]|nr:response regulator [Elusimicrobiota bacterium]